MTVQTVKLGREKYVIVRQRDYQQMSKRLDEMDAMDRADIRLAKKRMSDPTEKPIPYDKVRKELGLA